MTIAGAAHVSQAVVSRESPALVRWRAYFKERFPFLKHGILIACFYSSNQFLAHALVSPGGTMVYDLGSLLGCLTILCLFLHLRVFDDLKDYTEDCQHYPDRVLQRGIITLRELKILGCLTFAAEIALSLLWSPAALVAVLIAQGFSLLMFQEFFVRSWLKRHFIVYASTHMLIIPLMGLVIFSFATRAFPWEAPGWFLLYCFVGFFVAFNWEISRKIRAPEEEIEGVDSYTKIFGTYGAAHVVLLVRTIDTALVALVGYHLQVSVWFYAALLLLFAFCLVGYFQYRWWTTPQTARRMEAYAGVYIAAFDLTLIVELGRTHGISFESIV